MSPITFTLLKSTQHGTTCPFAFTSILLKICTQTCLETASSCQRVPASIPRLFSLASTSGHIDAKFSTKILSVIGASQKPILQACSNINNAVAAVYKGQRYILYDRDFMNSLTAGSNQYWSNMFILAHEVGHHINGHSLDILLYAAEAIEPKTLANKRQQELEADEFAGFILAKLGATLEQTSSSINLISSEKDDTYDTHPSKSKRLASIEIGYNKSLGKEKVVYETTTNLQLAEEYFYSALKKKEQNDYDGAIVDYNKAIENNLNYTYAYNDRGIVKYILKDYDGAIVDYTKAIEINPNLFKPYYNRGTVKSSLKDYYGAIADYTKAIELDPDEGWTYSFRGYAKGELKDYYGAIEDCTKAIQLKPNFAEAYFSRGLAKGYLGDNNGACKDARKSQELGNYKALELVNVACK